MPNPFLSAKISDVVQCAASMLRQPQLSSDEVDNFEIVHLCAHLRKHCVHIKGLRDVHIKEHNKVRIKAHNVCTTRSAQYINVQQNVRYTLHLCTKWAPCPNQI